MLQERILQIITNKTSNSFTEPSISRLEGRCRVNVIFNSKYMNTGYNLVNKSLPDYFYTQ